MMRELVWGVAWRMLRRLGWFGRLATRFAAARCLLPAVLTKTDSAALRHALFLPAGTGGTQLNQDVFALLANQFRRGYFVEIGANDGFCISNTLFLEQHFGWTGLLIEANPRYRESLTRRAQSTVVCKAITTAPGRMSFADAGVFGGLVEKLDSLHARHTAQAPRIEVDCDILDAVFDNAGVPDLVDFLSIDVEGGELTIVRQLTANHRRVRCGCIEVNERAGDTAEIKGLLRSAGYEIVWDGMSGNDLFFVDPLLVWHDRAES
jgi:FkbM family methyltransferase